MKRLAAMLDALAAEWGKCAGEAFAAAFHTEVERYQQGTAFPPMTIARNGTGAPVTVVPSPFTKKR